MSPETRPALPKLLLELLLESETAICVYAPLLISDPPSTRRGASTSCQPPTTTWPHSPKRCTLRRPPKFLMKGRGSCYHQQHLPGCCKRTPEPRTNRGLKYLDEPLDIDAVQGQNRNRKSPPLTHRETHSQRYCPRGQACQASATLSPKVDPAQTCAGSTWLARRHLCV